VAYNRTCLPYSLTVMDNYTVRSQLVSTDSHSILKQCFLDFGTSAVPSSNDMLTLSYTARATAFKTLKQGLVHGHLVITDSRGEHHFGQWKDVEDETRVQITIISDNTWGEIFLSHDLGCACILFLFYCDVKLTVCYSRGSVDARSLRSFEYESSP
jgi:hypothetical protein